MSGIYIPGMVMPTMCCDCQLYVEDIYYCPLLHREIENPWADDGVELDCPLVPVPEHGRLGDLDALKEILKPVKAIRDYEPEWTWGELYESTCKAIESLPTIIPADKEGEG